jgi:CheY-like chemotaxis protein
VRSETGRGSRFYIEVPLAPAATAPAAEAAAEPEAANLAGAKILAVDDDEMVRDAVARIMSDWGCAVATAGTPAEALDRIEHQGFRPDLLLVDYNLGTMLDGLGLVDLLLRRLPAAPPAILVTGSTDTAAILRFESSGHAWLSKPVDSAQLRRTAAHLLGRSQLRS